ncbi:MAG TPA: Re/Si-specific NAD(P)(+) transhydrogenase subunit alpha [Bdellovibrionota bacterium]|jgi:NAD(P) transhydrogenase subunit alpha
MRIGIPKETRALETRVAATPDSVKKLKKKNFTIAVEKGAGTAAHYPDEAYSAAGAEIVTTDSVFNSDLVAKIHKPTPEEIKRFPKGAVLASLLEPYLQDGTLQALASQGVSSLALELIPRTSRAQSMDVLSSQAGVAGYRAVLEAATLYGRFFPMMMTSAGSVKACKFAVLGVGVAGLQAIATARKLGAVVEAYDVRPEVRDQIISLGAKPIELDIGESGSGSGGYAKELSEDAKRKQQDALTQKLKTFDIIVTTANIPGKKSPTLVTEEAVEGMRAGSVIVDMAAANGGNCPLTEAEKVVSKHGVTLVGITNYPSLCATDASHFYAQNLVNLIDILWTKKEGGAPELNLADDIVAAALVTNKGDLCRRP